MSALANEEKTTALVNITEHTMKAKEV